jgi:hypothetical protein
LPSNFKIEPPKNIGLEELSIMAKTKEPGVRTQEKIEETKKFPVQSKLHGEDGEIWEEKVLSKD